MINQSHIKQNNPHITLDTLSTSTMEKLFETTRERRFAIVVAILVALVLVGSSISIANHNAIVQAVNDDSVQDLRNSRRQTEYF
jgi:hypothetical protein